MTIFPSNLTKSNILSTAFTEADFMRLWKGLFYCMWMSDKPLIQEELAESLSNIVHCFDSMETALLYTKCTLKTLATEWFGIDRYRLDKFQMVSFFRANYIPCFAVIMKSIKQKILNHVL